MVNIQVPECLTGHKQLKSSGFSFVYYNECRPAGRNLISFSHYAVSFILSGQKELYLGANSIMLGQTDGVIIPHGNAIIAERTLAADKYSSLVVFFEPVLATAFLSQYAAANSQSLTTKPAAKKSILHFKQNPYMIAYITGLIALIDRQVPVVHNLLVHKLHELFIILVEQFQAEFYQLFNPNAHHKDQRLRQIVENNIINNLSLSELAFLSNCSVAKFKRDFEKEYQMSPGKYMRNRKLEIARHQVTKGEPLQSIASGLGYENVSNFIGAFKKQYGMTPKTYQSAQKLSFL
jgi:AraC-like DNA-binding protein